MRITDLVEKPQLPQHLDALRTPSDWLAGQGLTDGGRDYLANMGIYLFSRDALVAMLRAHPQAHDMVTELLAPSLATYNIRAYLFRGYWEDVGSIASYHRASLALASDELPIDFHSNEAVIYTRMRDLPASRISGARMDRCHLSDGCVVRKGAVIERCVLGVRSLIGRNVRMRDVVMLGANFYEDHRPDQKPRHPSMPRMGVGDDSVLDRVIVDKNCRIGRKVRITNRDKVQEADAENYVIRDGIVVLPNGAVIPDGTEI
jgi:glucose-1-phosphate adenylyltransferase